MRHELMRAHAPLLNRCMQTRRELKITASMMQLLPAVWFQLQAFITSNTGGSGPVYTMFPGC